MANDKFDPGFLHFMGLVTRFILGAWLISTGISWDAVVAEGFKDGAGILIILKPVLVVSGLIIIFRANKAAASD